MSLKRREIAARDKGISLCRDTACIERGMYMLLCEHKMALLTHLPHRSIDSLDEQLLEDALTTAFGLVTRSLGLLRVGLDRAAATGRSRGTAFPVLGFHHEPHQTLEQLTDVGVLLQGSHKERRSVHNSVGGRGAEGSPWLTSPGT